MRSTLNCLQFSRKAQAVTALVLAAIIQRKNNNRYTRSAVTTAVFVDALHLGEFGGVADAKSSYRTLHRVLRPSLNTVSKDNAH